MQSFFEEPYLFWYGFVFSFLICTGFGAIVQCWFILHFCNQKGKRVYYLYFVLFSYAMYIWSFFSSVQVPAIVDTFLGVGVLIFFSGKILKQDRNVSAILAALTVAVTALVESILFLAGYCIGDSIIIPFADGLLFPVISFLFYRFFVIRYSFTSRYQSKYMLAFSLPIFFISVMLRTMNSIRYSVTIHGITLQTGSVKDYELILLTGMAFFCICIILVAYEKTIQQVERENQNMLLETQVALQKSYVAEAGQKYEATRAFRHDFNNHMLVLRGLIEAKDAEKTAAYMNRFEEIYHEITFPIHTGNHVIDTLLGEKFAYARQLGICVKSDICIPTDMEIDDFDLCAVFANVIDNGIRACGSVEKGKGVIEVAANPNHSFFLIDIQNNYRKERIQRGSGIGLTTVTAIVDKYQGAVDISKEDDKFRISIILPFN